MKHTETTVLKRFMQDSKGTVAMLFGLSLIPIVAGTGVAIDYGRASNSRQAFQSAADAAALAGAKARAISDTEATKIAKQVFDANLKLSGYEGTIVPTVQFFEPGGVRVLGSAQLANTFLPVVGIKTADVSYHAEASATTAASSSGSVVGDEIALVLDNTGSMSNDMQTLREASVAFVDKAMTGKTKVSVVPFVTAVNVGPGNLAMSHLDTRADSQWHGAFIRYTTSPTRGALWWPYSIGVVESGCKPVGGPVIPPNPGGGGKGASLDNGADHSDDIMRSLLGIGRAHAQSPSVTPNTIPPLQGVTKMSGPGSNTPMQVLVPTGFNDNNGGFCTLGSVIKVSHFDLIARTPNARWKGCVEARPEPFDVTDEPPQGGVADSLYVPYFWPDEHDAIANWLKEGVNNYMSDGNMPKGWLQVGETGGRTANILKYDGSNVPRIVETAPDTMGPNKACPSELLRLTDDKVKVKNTLQNMKHWNGGGTILVEGLAWGWRSLSPLAPFADGKPYTKDAKKTIVFMSDGDNEMGDAPGTENYSHYTGYGYLRSGRFPTATFAAANSYLDERFLLACDNAKKKGIKIVTILFRNKQGNSVDMMRKCASTAADAYFAGDQVALKKTFDSIAGTFASAPLKLTK
jgi:Flp pilus assembly protein TadG